MIKFSNMQKPKITTILLLVILLIAAVFRFWQLNEIPPGLYPDVAINGINALDDAGTGNFKVFYPDNNGREGVFFWLISISFMIFGPSIWAIKIVPALIGFLTVLGMYFLTKEIFSKEKRADWIALLATLFLAASFWHTNFSRIGFRAIMVPFCLVFAFYFLFKAFNSKKVWPLVIAGFFFGLGFYTYIAYRFIIFILTIVLACWWLVYKKQGLQKTFLRFTVYCLSAIFVTGLPIGIYFLLHPADFFGRAGGVSVFAEKNPLFALAKSFILHLGMFNFYGDGNWRHNFAGQPMLPWLIGILFVLGMVLSIKSLISSIKNRNYSLLTIHCLLLSWFFFMLAPGFLSAEGAPHALRVIGLIPVVYIFSALGSVWAFERIRMFFRTKWQVRFFYCCIFILLSLVVVFEFSKYFYYWGEKPEVAAAFSQNYTDIGNYLNSLPDDVQKYVIVNQDGVRIPLPNGLPMPAQTSIFIERAKYGKTRAIYLEPNDIGKIKPEKNTVILPLQFDDDLFLKLSQAFPKGEIQRTGSVWFYKITN